MPTDSATPADGDILDALPYGVVAVAPDGEILRTNAAAHDLVPGLASRSANRCRDLFACSAAGGPCERGCLVARAAASSELAPEIRIDAAAGSSPGALWVTVSPLPSGRGAILHLRPGARQDRRRRSLERWSTEPDLRIRVLGRTRVDALSDSLATEWVSQRPGQVLKYLVCERARVVMVDEIAEAIWPERGPGAVSNARYAIHRLRMSLEPRRAAHDPPSFVLAREGGYSLERERVWIDADEFEQAVEQGRAAMARLAPAQAAESFERAVALYRGPFLADEPYTHWATDERNHLAGLATYALWILSALASERGDRLDAIRHLKRLAELEPLDSNVHRELVQALIGEGERSDAKRRYDSFSHRLWRELGLRPEFDLRSLARHHPAGPDPHGSQA